MSGPASEWDVAEVGWRVARHLYYAESEFPMQLRWVLSDLVAKWTNDIERYAMELAQSLREQHLKSIGWPFWENEGETHGDRGDTPQPT